MLQILAAKVFANVPFFAPFKSSAQQEFCITSPLSKSSSLQSFKLLNILRTIAAGTRSLRHLLKYHRHLVLLDSAKKETMLENLSGFCYIRCILEIL
jgi:hypothetical protein